MINNFVKYLLFFLIGYEVYLSIKVYNTVIVVYDEAIIKNLSTYLVITSKSLFKISGMLKSKHLRPETGWIVF